MDPRAPAQHRELTKSEGAAEVPEKWCLRKDNESPVIQMFKTGDNTPIASRKVTTALVLCRLALVGELYAYVISVREPVY